MAKIVSFASDEFRGFEIFGPPAWVEGRCLPAESPGERRLGVLPESSGLPNGDFMSVSGLSYRGGTTFVASEAAWNSLLKGRFGVLELSDVADCPRSYRVVLVAGKLDVIDFERSVEQFPGYFKGLHVHEIADELAGASVFTPVGANETWLLCGDRWADCYFGEGLTGLSFEGAVVG